MRPTFLAGTALFPLELVEAQVRELVDLAERLSSPGRVDADADRIVMHASVAAQALDSLGQADTAWRMLQVAERSIVGGPVSTLSMAEYVVALAHHADRSGEWQLCAQGSPLTVEVAQDSDRWAGAKLEEAAAAYRACHRMATVLQKWEGHGTADPSLHSAAVHWAERAQALRSVALPLLDEPSAVSLWETSMILLARLLPLSDGRVRTRVQETARRLKGELPDGCIFLYHDHRHAEQASPVDLSEMGYPAGAAMMGIHAPLAREMLILHASAANRPASQADEPADRELVDRLGVTAAPLHMLATFGLCLQLESRASLAFVRYNPYMAPYDVGGPAPVQATKGILQVGDRAVIRMERPVAHCEVDYRTGWLAIENLGTPSTVELDLGDWTVPPTVQQKAQVRDQVHLIRLDPWERLELRLVNR